MIGTVTEQDSFSQLLTDEIKNPELLVRVKATLEPYYVIASSDQPYPLKAESELDQEAIAHAIQQALRLRTIPKVEFVSQNSFAPKASWMGWESYYQRIWKMVGFDSRNTLADCLNRDRSQDILAKLGYDENSLWSLLGNSLGVHLIYSLGKVWNHITLQQYLTFALHYYLGYAIADNQRIADELEPLVKVQTGCIVVSTKKDEPNTWLVLCA